MFAVHIFALLHGGNHNGWTRSVMGALGHMVVGALGQWGDGRGGGRLVFMWWGDVVAGEGD